MIGQWAPPSREAAYLVTSALLAASSTTEYPCGRCERALTGYGASTSLMTDEVESPWARIALDCHE